MLRAIVPESLLRANGTENDIRCHATKRKVSGGTCSESGRLSPDFFLGLMKTCQKLGIPFFNYLGARRSSFPTSPPSHPSQGVASPPNPGRRLL